MSRKFNVIFMLGGPGSGKGTQSSLIEKHFNFKHLSAGQLLRNQQERPHSQYGSAIQQVINTGKIVPSYITIQLLKNEMEAQSQRYNQFLIDGFPRNLENYNSWQQLAKDHSETPFILHLVCTEEEMLRRLKIRSQSQNRSDDTPQIIRKRFATYREQTLSVISQFQKESKVKNIDADKSVSQIFDQIKPIFEQYLSSPKIH